MMHPADATLAIAPLDSPIGRLRVVASDAGLTGVLFPDTERVAPHHPGGARARAHCDHARRALERYFEGASTEIGGLTLAAHGTDFQRQVWRELARIPFGESRSYADIAQSLGKPKAVRAVGLANARNPIPIVVPCHRVIGANGALTGYRGGLAAKRWLLEFEGVLSPRLL